MYSWIMFLLRRRSSFWWFGLPLWPVIGCHPPFLGKQLLMMLWVFWCQTWNLETIWRITFLVCEMLKSLSSFNSYGNVQEAGHSIMLEYNELPLPEWILVMLDWNELLLREWTLEIIQASYRNIAASVISLLSGCQQYKRY